MEEALKILSRIEETCCRVGRDSSTVKIVGATKKQPVDRINEYISFCNKRGSQALIGENYVQEWAQKSGGIQGDYSCHLIGHLQSNKAGEASKIFSTIQSVDSERLAEKLNAACRSTSKILPVFIQVNISSDDAKSGINKEQAPSLVRTIISFPALRLAGLMTIPKLYSGTSSGIATAREDYRALYSLSQHLQAEFQLPSKLEVSMGMSDDFEVAIEEGATMIRVGSALFGGRS